MTRTAGAQIGCQRPSRFWGLGCPKIYHEAEDTLVNEVPRDLLQLVLLQPVYERITGKPQYARCLTLVALTFLQCLL
ncbi:hypothetical protein [Thiolapillus sp.]|uniref:hypothetical protein n=1 Tax=Thiolapillus sp. TaxID=2017437 RepID=UPI00263A6A1F|nr:hypothetical protein [Thiolapillus sp.]